MKSFEAVLAAFLFVSSVNADTPANCTYDDISGRWLFMMGPTGGDRSLNCTDPGPLNFYNLTVDLLYPDVAVDVSSGSEGFWTLIYNQGFEVVLNNRKYFAFSKYKTSGKNVTSICSETLPGWSHNVVGTDWACYSGRKLKGSTEKSTVSTRDILLDQPFKNDHGLIKQINSVQSSWTAGAYDEYDLMTWGQMLQKAGGAKTYAPLPKPAPVTEEVAKIADSLPDSFDWRAVDGQSFVPSVRNQGQCGSCYSFSSVGMLEARFRVASNNTFKPVFSPQEIVSCGEYSQGCEGGFPYLIAGKYAEDFGVVEESCYKYEGKDSSCKKTKCKRYYATDYQYVGGYYGACNEPLMRIQLVKNGPMSVSFEVLDDFFQYKGGIYHHTGLGENLGKFNPFHLTNHAVLLVGYGADNATGEKFWIVENSWGQDWGENGYFRIRRGTDEVSIESIAVESFPIYP